MTTLQIFAVSPNVLEKGSNGPDNGSGGNAKHGMSGRAGTREDMSEVEAIEDKRNNSVYELGDAKKQQQPGRGSRELVEEAHA
ncbi:hypothetical protein LTR28_001081 [Elasticomyces elasticus]|nr:hypothetical protein LTR28_001081 [Elasticomyces elasticus]